MECAYYLALLNGIVVNRVAIANLANSNFAKNNRSIRQNCEGPRLGVNGYEFQYSLDQSPSHEDREDREHRGDRENRGEAENRVILTRSSSCDIDSN